MIKKERSETFIKVKNYFLYFVYVLLPNVFLIPNKVCAAGFAGGYVKDGKLSFAFDPRNSGPQENITMVSEGNKLLKLLSAIVNGIEGLAAIILIGIFSYKAFQLAVTSNNAMERAKSKQAMMNCLIGIVIVGGIHFILGALRGLFKF